MEFATKSPEANTYNWGLFEKVNESRNNNSYILFYICTSPTLHSEARDFVLMLYRYATLKKINKSGKKLKHI